MTEEQAIERIVAAIEDVAAASKRARMNNDPAFQRALYASAAWNEIKAIAREDMVTVETQEGGNPLTWPVTQDALLKGLARHKATIAKVDLAL